MQLADSRLCALLALFGAACGIGHAAQPAPSEGREPTSDAPALAPASSPAPACPPEMARVKSFCVDRHEAHVVAIDAQGNEKPHSPYAPVAGLKVRAKSAQGVVPQAYISQLEAQAACHEAGKRLCTEAEFTLACRGPDASAKYPYGGTARRPGACNEGKGSSMTRFFGRDSMAWTLANFNDPRLNQWPGGLAKTGQYAECVSPFGVYDAVGNLHEWGADPPDERRRGRFRGGFYGDAEVNGPGCSYVTRAHGVRYHDYSTGFRCCSDAGTLRAP